MMDLDPTGGLDLLCGQSVLSGLRWADLPAEESAFRPGHLVGALPVWHAMPVLTGDVRGGPLPCAEAVLEAMRVEHDVVLVDLPRGAPPPPGAGVLILTGLDLLGSGVLVLDVEGRVAFANMAACQLLAKNGLREQVMIDFSHANSSKQHRRQIDVAQDVAGQIANGDTRITGVMIESHLNEGRQDIQPGQALQYGVSVTDACLSMEQTIPVLQTLAQAVRKRRQTQGR